MMVVMGDTGLRTTIPPTRFKLINQYLEYTGDGCRRQEAHTTTARGSHQGVWETGALHRGTSETVGQQGHCSGHPRHGNPMATATSRGSYVYHPLAGRERHAQRERHASRLGLV